MRLNKQAQTSGYPSASQASATAGETPVLARPLGLTVRIARWYLSLAPGSAPEYWRERIPFQRARMEYDDEVAGGFLDWFPQLDLRGKDILDLGCGYGGRTVRYAELGARSVSGNEVTERSCQEAHEFGEHKSVSLKIVLAPAEALPFEGNSFDVILSYDVLEHVCNVEQSLRECLRILRPGASLYAIFPPFYHPTGAHFEDWLSRMPWPNVFFPCRNLIDAGNGMLASRGDDFQPNPLRAGDKLWCLNGITISKTQKILTGIEADYRFECAPLFSRRNRKWRAWHMKYYAWMFSGLRHIFLLREMFTNRIVLTLTKR
jgi:SAM-dependent methyltransferase